MDFTLSAPMGKNGTMTTDAVPKPGPKRAVMRPKKKWGWLVMLVVIVVLFGGGYGFFRLSNALAASRYEEHITSGDTAGVLAIPRFGAEWRVPVIAGTSLADLRQGVGWYDGTAAPGQVGNFALAGHKLGWGQPFEHLADLQVGDEINVTVGDDTYTYTVITGPTTVSNKDVDVLAPVPGDPTRTPTKALITLTTTATWLPSPSRVVVVGELSG